MASCLVLALICVACYTVNAQDTSQGNSASFSMDWLNPDGFSVWNTNEGDKLTIFCWIVVPSGTPFASIKIEWLKYGSEDKVTISENGQITYYDGRNRFSAPSLTHVYDNTTEYRLTVSDIDRYDSAAGRFWCVFQPYNSSTSTSVWLNVDWDPPLPQCSSNVIAKAKRGDEAAYKCSSLDKDRLSAGSLAMWKSGTKLTTAGEQEDVGDGSTQYNTSYTTQITDDSLEDVYMCIYTATGGFEDYNYDCTFDRPDCAVSSCGHHIIIVTFALLLFII